MGRGPNPVICLNDPESSTFEQRYGIETVTRTYTLYNYDTRNDAEVALLNSPLCPYDDPDQPGVLRRADISMDVIDPARKIYNAEVVWRRFLPDAIGDEKISGSISSVTVKQRVAVNHISDAWIGGYEDNFFNGAINVVDLEIEGVDVPYAAMQFTISKTYPVGTGATVNNLAILYNYVEKPNILPWRGFNIGDVKLIGVDVSNFDDNEDVINYTFAASPTVYNIVIPTLSPIPPHEPAVLYIPVKRGWDYLWVGYETFEVNKKKYSGIVSAHVEQVQQMVDLNQILP